MPKTPVRKFAKNEIKLTVNSNLLRNPSREREFAMTLKNSLGKF